MAGSPLAASPVLASVPSHSASAAAAASALSPARTSSAAAAAVSPASPSAAVLRRWAAMTGRTRLASVLRLAAARWTAERDAGIESPSVSRIASVYRRSLRVAWGDPIEVSDLAVNGRDLEKAGITGPAVGRALRMLLETVINDPASNSRDSLLAMVEEHRATLNGEV